MLIRWPAHDVGVVLLKSRHIEAPTPAMLASGEGFEQKLAHSGDLDMFGQNALCIAAALGLCRQSGVESGEHILVAGVGIGDRRHVGDDQTAYPRWRQLGDLHPYLAPHRVAYYRRLIKLKVIHQRENVGRLRRIAHLAAMKGGAVVAQIDADDPVLFAEGTGQQAEVIEAAKQAVDQNDRRALTLLLEVQYAVLLQNDTLSVVGAYRCFI